MPSNGCFLFDYTIPVPNIFNCILYDFHIGSFWKYTDCDGDLSCKKNAHFNKLLHFKHSHSRFNHFNIFDAISSE